MSRFWKRDQALTTQMKINKIERDKIRIEKEQAKIDRMKAQTRIREKSGGASVSVTFPDATPLKDPPYLKYVNAAPKKRYNKGSRTKTAVQGQKVKKQARHKDGRFKAQKYGSKSKDPLIPGTTETGGRVPFTVENGKVPEKYLIRRFNEFYAGDDAKSNSKWKDYSHRTEIVFPKDAPPELIGKWWVRPDMYDVEDIDAAGDTKKIVQDVKVVSTDAEKKIVSDAVSKSFTKSELDVIAKMPGIRIFPHALGSGHSGTYMPLSGQINADRENLDNNGTIVHETVHALRDRDKNRKGLMKHSDIHAIEESLTVAEQQARTTEPGYSGYYGMVKVFDTKKRRWVRPTIKEAIRMAEEDHALFGGGKVGSDAQAIVKKNWADSHISRLSYKSHGRSAKSLAKELYPEEFGSEGTEIKTQGGTGKVGVTADRKRKGVRQKKR